MFDKLRREWHLRDLDKRIRQHGWTAMYVGDYERSPCWAYSIGFEENLGQPEVVVFDVSQADANSLLWWIYKSIESGELAPREGQPWTPEGDVIGVWREVHPTHVNGPDGWFAAALERRERRGATQPLRAFQLVVRDEAQKFPWEHGYNERLRMKQPALYVPARDYGEVSLSPLDRQALRAEAYQLFLSDDADRYPWDPGCAKDVRDCQPLLFEPHHPDQLKRAPLAALMRM